MITLELPGNTTRTVIAKLLESKFSNDEKQGVLICRNTLVRQFKSYIDNNLNPARVNVIDLTKDSST